MSTYEHRSFELADVPIVFTPQTDLAILNYIANYIIKNGKVNEDFVDKHVNFRKGAQDIGYGLRPEHPLEKAAANNTKAGGSEEISFKEFAEFVADYDLKSVSKLSGVPENLLEELAEMYADPNRKIMSLWTMGVNQHTRGVWVNNMIYNIHLLTGKIATPGNSPFSLTGQPSACGTAREVGTFAHRLPADMVVTNKDHRKKAEKIWKLPSGSIPDWVGSHAVQQNRDLKDGKINAYWVQVNNNVQAAPNLNEETLPGYRNPDNFIVVGFDIEMFDRQRHIEFDVFLIGYKANHLNRQGFIRVGQNLRIPGSQATSSSVQYDIAQNSRHTILKDSKKYLPASLTRLHIEEDLAVSGNLKVVQHHKKADLNTGIVEVQPDESIGLFSDWLKVTPKSIRLSNNISSKKDIYPGQKVVLEFLNVSAQDFEELRFDFHQEIQEDFFNSYSVVDVTTYKVSNGDTIWELCHKKFDVPLWLLKKYNDKLNYNRLDSSTSLQIPVLREI